MASSAPPSDRSPWIIGLLIAAILVLAAAMIPSPYAIERPGPVVDALGSIETENGPVPVVTISGAETYPASGEINILSVTVQGSPERPMHWLGVLPALLDPTQALVPLSERFPEGIDSEERAAMNAAMMRNSQVQATAAALESLGIPVGGELRVATVLDDGPSAGELEAGDRIVSAAGTAIDSLAQLQEILRLHGTELPIPLVVDRAGSELPVAVVPVAAAPGAQPMLGVTVSMEIEFPFDVEIQVDRIGGPSAGLVLALAVRDLLDPDDLLGGLAVSGTGTIDEYGTVGAIGGLAQKLWGAERAGTDLFLMPVGNCADLPDRRPTDFPIVPVATLEEALDALAAVQEGNEPPGLERCATVGARVAGAD